MVVGGVGTILTAGYFLWMLQRVNLGRIPQRWEGKQFADVEPLEMIAWAPLLVLILILGVVPSLLLDLTGPSVSGLIEAIPR